MRFRRISLFVGVALLCSLPLALSCSDNSATGPGDYSRDEMFKVEFKSWSIAGYANIELFFLVEAFGQGSNPFAMGPVHWESVVLLEKCYKTSDGKYYIFSETVEANKLKTVSAGWDWNGNVNNSTFLTGEDMVGNRYFNPKTDNFGFKVSSNGYIQTP